MITIHNKYIQNTSKLLIKCTQFFHKVWISLSALFPTSMIYPIIFHIIELFSASSIKLLKISTAILQVCRKETSAPPTVSDLWDAFLHLSLPGHFRLAVSFNYFSYYGVVAGLAASVKVIVPLGNDSPAFIVFTTA